MSRTTLPRGNVLPLVALCLAALSGFAGLSVDVGYWEYRQQAQQSAADSAAIGGAQQLAYAGCPNRTTARTSAQADAANNAFSNAGNTVVTVNNPPASGAFASDNCAVNVTITTQHVSSFFSRVVGFNNGAGAQETTQATATLTSQGAGCVYMLQIGQNTNWNGSNVVAPYCSILLNGSANFNGATVNAAGIGEYNYSGSNNGGTFTQASPVPMLPVADPCPEIAGCAFLTNNPPSTANCNGTYGNNGMLSPGCYTNLSLNMATVTFQPGLYVFAGSTNVNKATITANNVTISLPAGASINFNKANNLVLTAPTTGNTAGVAYYQVKGDSNDVNFNS
ncbi:MAG TPA: pilus assembly protein TadG-related protein, partial [Candidatus Cybelea sp.]